MTNNPLSSLAQALQGAGSGIQQVAQDAPPSPQDAPQRTDSPDIGGGTPSNDQLMQELGGTPSVQTSLPPRPGAVKGLLTNYLDMMSQQLAQMNKPQGAFGRFRQGFSDSALQSSGAADYRLNKQQQVAQAIQLDQNQDYKELQGQQYAPMELPFDLQDGQGNVLVPRGTKLPANLMEKLLANQSVQATKQKIAGNAEAGKNLRAGYDANGKPLPISELPIPMQLKQESEKLRQELTQARIDAMNADPNTPAGRMAIMKYQIAQQNARANMAKASAMGLRAGTDLKRYMADYYGMGSDGEALPGAPMQNGQPIGLKTAGNKLVGEAYKAFQPALESDMRLKQMEQQANDLTGASDMALLFNHIAMTGGNVKGMRLGETLTKEHMRARGISEELGVLYNHAASGQALSPQQRTNFVKLAYEVRNSRWQEAMQQAAFYGGGNTPLPPPDPNLPPINLEGVDQKQFKPVGGRYGGNNNKPTASAAPPVNLLKEGMVTTFKNGQSWTLQNGKATQVNGR